MRHYLRYHFDNLMSRGVLAQILLLALITVALVAITVALVFATGSMPEDSHGATTGWTAWKSLMHALDPGTLASDDANWTFLFIMLFATIGGLLVLSALIGVLNQGFGQLIENLRRGRSHVIERRHTVILGWTPKIRTLLEELAIANANQRRACVVILAERDKLAMDSEVAGWLGRTRLRVVTRTGSPLSTADLALVNLAASRAVIVLAPERSGHEADTVVLRTLLALTKGAPNGDIKRLHIVAELREPASERVARMVTGPRAALIVANPLLSKLLVQTGRQSGLSVVYSELLDFTGNEIYVQPAPALTGVRFRDAVHRYGTSSLIGVVTADGDTLLPPPLERPFAAGDQVIAISEDDDTLVLDGTPPSTDRLASRPPVVRPQLAERTLILGIGSRLPAVLGELAKYAAPGSEVIVVGDHRIELVPPSGLTVHTRVGDLTDRELLEALDAPSFDHVLVLSEAAETQELADARTTVTLLHLRDIARTTGKRVAITSEILDVGSRELAAVTEADDFIVSNSLISLMLSQVAENPYLVAVFDRLFSADGYEIYLHPITDYVAAGRYRFADLCEAALHRDEIAIGYRRVDPDQAARPPFGIAINPPKRDAVTFADSDQLIVLAER